MRQRLVLVVLLVLFINITSTLAQTGPDAASLIDQHAAANGLPAGNGQVSSAEQTLGSAIEQGATAFNQEIVDFEADGPENSAWVGKLDQAAGQFDQQLAEAQTSFDPRAQAISDAVAQYGEETSELRSQATFDPRAQAISDAVAQYGTERRYDPRAQAISDAVAQYGQENNALTPEQQREVVKSVKEGAGEYIDRNGTIQRKNVVKRYVWQIIEVAIPSQMLPINGYWRIRPYTPTTSGTCLASNTYGIGPESGPDEPDPSQSLCGYDLPPGLPFIVWGGIHPYLPGTGSMYGQEGRKSSELILASSGATTGSVQETTTTIYEVVAPDLIVVHYVREEEGGCVTSADYALELVTPDDSICLTQTVPTEEPEEPETSKPPVIQEGPYHKVGMPYIQDETQCDDSNRPPAFEEIRLLPQPDRSLLIDYGIGTQIVYPYGGSRNYVFDSGRDGDLRRRFSLTLDKDGMRVSLTWNVQNNDQRCYVSQDFALPGYEPPDTDVPANDSPPPDTASAPAMEPPAPGTYTVAWSPIPGLDCPPELQPTVPTFTEATVSHTDSGLTLDGGGQSYPMTEQGAQFLYMAYGTDGSGYSIYISAVDEDGGFTGGFMAFAAGGKTCMLSVQFTPK